MKRKTGRKRARPRNCDDELLSILARKRRRRLDSKFPRLRLSQDVSSFNVHPRFEEPDVGSYESHPFLTTLPFTRLNLVPHLQEALRGNGYVHLTRVQALSLPRILSGSSLFVQAPTGTGKTLSFLVPILDMLDRHQYSPPHGLCGLVLAPTRELALQIYHECERLIDKTRFTCACCIGGANRFKESQRLIDGVNVLIGTPGRVLDHVLNTDMNVRNLRFFVLDEADRMLERGFEMDVRAIIRRLFRRAKKRKRTVVGRKRRRRQKQKQKQRRTEAEGEGVVVGIDEEQEEEPTAAEEEEEEEEEGEGTAAAAAAVVDGENQGIQTLLFSATNDEAVRTIAERFFRQKYDFVQASPPSAVVSEVMENALRNLSHAYVIIPTDKKFMLLLTFLRRHRRAKLMVFFATCAAVQYFARLCTNMNVRVKAIHGEMAQRRRTETFLQFRTSREGILFSTNVCARGLDMTDVAWIVQYDPPSDARDYVHRVGRSARAGKKGNAVLFLCPNEEAYVGDLEEKVAGLQLKRLRLGDGQLMDVQAHVEELVEQNYALLKLAHLTFQVKVYSYRSYPNREIFTMKTLDFEGLSKQLGLPNIPYIPWDERREELE